MYTPNTVKIKETIKIEFGIFFQLILILKLSKREIMISTSYLHTFI